MYALGEFDCQSIVLDLVEMIVSGNVEVSEQAFSIVEGCVEKMEADVARQVQRSVAAAVMPQVSEEKQALLQDVLSLFE